MRILRIRKLIFMNPQEFKNKWNSKVDARLCAFTPIQLEGVNLSVYDKSFLIESGLPVYAAPYLNFTENRENKIQSVKERFGDFNDQDQVEEFLVIGLYRDYEPVCINGENGQILYLGFNHLEQLEPTLMNSSITQLVEFLLVYRDFVESLINQRGENAWYDCNFTDQEFIDLETKLLDIDEAAMDLGCFWNQDLGILLENRS